MFVPNVGDRIAPQFSACTNLLQVMVEIESSGVKFKNAFSVRCKKTTRAQKLLI
jgi:hypothetical protein